MDKITVATPWWISNMPWWSGLGSFFTSLAFFDGQPVDYVAYGNHYLVEPYRYMFSESIPYWYDATGWQTVIIIYWIFVYLTMLVPFLIYVGVTLLFLFKMHVPGFLISLIGGTVVLSFVWMIIGYINLIFLPLVPFITGGIAYYYIKKYIKIRFSPRYREFVFMDDTFEKEIFRGLYKNYELYVPVKDDGKCSYERDKSSFVYMFKDKPVKIEFVAGPIVFNNKTYSNGYFKIFCNLPNTPPPVKKMFLLSAKLWPFDPPAAPASLPLITDNVLPTA